MKVIKNANGTYTHISTNGIETNNLKVVFDKRKGCGDIKLPEHSSRKWLSESRFHDGITEVELGAPVTRTSNPGTTSPRLSWIDFVEDEDKEIFETIKAKAEAKMNKAQKLREYENLKAQMAKMMAELGMTEEVEA